MNQLENKVNTFNFPLWATIELGVGPKTTDELKLALKGTGAYTCIGMNYFLNQIEISQEGTLCNLFTASNKELGFKGKTKLKDTHARILEIGGVLLPAEVAPQIVIQCGDKVDVDVGLTLAMESIVNQVYDPSLFVMKRYDHNPLLYLMISHGYPGTLWDANTRFVFGRQE